jgi:carbon-monoxide dehydrogenase medium subunit
MQPFEVCRPASIADAAAYLSAHPDAKPLAGGHSLIPVMKQDLVVPTALVDLSGIASLRGISSLATMVRIGAMCTHEEVAGSAVVAQRIPALAELAGAIGDRQVRCRGTLGGSLAANDPAADYPAAALALDAVVETNRRRIQAQDYFQGWYSTALEQGELLVAVEFAVPQWADYHSIRQPASGLALVGVFLAKHESGVRVAVTGAGANGVFRATAFEQALDSSFGGAGIEKIQADPADMTSDLHASAEYRAAMVKVLVRRSLAGHGSTTQQETQR